MTLYILNDYKVIQYVHCELNLCP